MKLKIESALQDVEIIVNILFEHAVSKKHAVSNFEFSSRSSTENCIVALQMAEDKDNISDSQYWGMLIPSSSCWSFAVTQRKTCMSP